MKMKNVLIFMMMFLLCTVPLFAQQYTADTKFAFALNLRDVADAIKGNSNIGASVRFSPVVPLYLENTDSTSLYLVPFAESGYTDDQWGMAGGVGVVKNFGNWYIRGGMELLQINEEAGKFEPSAVTNIGFGFKLNSLVNLDKFPNTYADIYFRYDPNTDKEYMKRQVEFSLVVLVL